MYRAFFLLVLLIPACAPTAKLTAVQEGTASWYGPGFHGRKTASGETYNQNDFTAAHRTLPLGTVVVVRNLKNGRSAKVKVNDRGPYVDGRIIDLSKAAAQKLGMIETGTARVKIYVPVNAPAAVRSRDPNREPEYTVQLGSFSSKADAEAKAAKVPGGWIAKAALNGKTVFRVNSGRFSTMADADIHRLTIQKNGLKGFVKQIE